MTKNPDAPKTKPKTKPESTLTAAPEAQFEFGVFAAPASDPAETKATPWPQAAVMSDDCVVIDGVAYPGDMTLEALIEKIGAGARDAVDRPIEQVSKIARERMHAYLSSPAGQAAMKSPPVNTMGKVVGPSEMTKLLNRSDTLRGGLDATSTLRQYAALVRFYEVAKWLIDVTIDPSPIMAEVVITQRDFDGASRCAQTILACVSWIRACEVYVPVSVKDDTQELFVLPPEILKAVNTPGQWGVAERVLMGMMAAYMVPGCELLASIVMCARGQCPARPVNLPAFKA